MKRLIILGGGAAGLAAALAASESGAEVTVCERDDRVAKKILRTGNGRCNFTNMHIEAGAYNKPGFVAPVLSRLGAGELRAFFESLGLYSYADEAGRVYPLSDAAASVADVLRLECGRRGVRFVCGFEAARVARGYTVTARDGRTLSADALIAATGGGTKICGELGLKMVPFSPVLCPLKTDLEHIKGLSGIRVDCSAALLREGREVARETGELLFRDYGVSGIMVFDLSRFSRRGDILSLNMLPTMTEGEVFELLNKRQRELGWRRDEDYLTGLFHSRLGPSLLRRAGGREAGRLCSVIRDFRLTVLGCGDVKQAQVTRGGLDTAEFEPITLRARRFPGLYACGEALDIDGRCGGFNLHWAFASGLTAGREAARNA